MRSLLNNFFDLCGEKRGNIKKSILFSFFDGIFESFPFLAVFYLFHVLENNGWNPEKITVKDILIITGILFFAILARWVIKYHIYSLQNVASYESVANTRLKVGDHLKRAPMGFFNENSIGDTTTTLTDDMHYIEKNAANILDKLVNGSINVFVLSIGMLFFDWKVGIVFLIGQLLSIMLISSMQTMTTKAVGTLKDVQSATNSKVLEFLKGVTVHKIYPTISKQNDRIQDSFEDYRNASYHSEKSFISRNFLFMIVTRTACAVIAFMSGYIAMNGRLSTVNAVVILIATFVLYRPLENLGSITGMVRMMEIALGRIKKIEDLSVMEGGAKEITFHSISLTNVSFGYQKDVKRIINNISLYIPEKKMTAIVGASGCGKTTLIRLIGRFWDVDTGKILIGDTDIRNVTPEKLYSHFSIVFQDVFLFHDTVENNIKLGNPNATHEEVIKAAKEACCHEFIEQLPKKYQTIIEESGNNFSGGEKQRISIARALLKDASIVLLDEATASVDPENEWMLNQAISKLCIGKTVVMVAHKMRTIMNADQIVVMNDGEIHNTGTHEELLKKDNIYQSYWKARENATKWKV